MLVCQKQIFNASMTNYVTEALMAKAGSKHMRVAWELESPSKAGSKHMRVAWAHARTTGDPMPSAYLQGRDREQLATEVAQRLVYLDTSCFT